MCECLRARLLGVVARRVDRVSGTLRYQNTALLHVCASLVVVIMWGVWATVAMPERYVVPVPVPSMPALTLHPEPSQRPNWSGSLRNWCIDTANVAAASITASAAAPSQSCASSPAGRPTPARVARFHTSS